MSTKTSSLKNILDSANSQYCAECKYLETKSFLLYVYLWYGIKREKNVLRIQFCIWYICGTLRTWWVKLTQSRVPGGFFHKVKPLHRTEQGSVWVTSLCLRYPIKWDDNEITHTYAGFLDKSQSAFVGRLINKDPCQSLIPDSHSLSQVQLPIALNEVDSVSIFMLEALQKMLTGKNSLCSWSYVHVKSVILKGTMCWSFFFVCSCGKRFFSGKKVTKLLLTEKLLSKLKFSLKRF